MIQATLQVSAIIPVHNGGHKLAQCLEAVLGSARPPDEVVVVDDASTDGSGDLARRHGARVVRLDGPAHGPAFSRNRGVEAATGEILFFVDADTVVHPDALALAVQTLEKGGRALAACFGSYDDKPASPGFLSQYKNLLHHHIHQTSSSSASTFWAGCGVIRRTVFEEVGGFDEGYARPSIEDIELGTRLCRAGYDIQLVKDMQATHLKEWTLASLLRSDVCHRAVPWTRLILRQGRIPDDLNLSVGARWSAISTCLLVLVLALGFAWRPLWLISIPLITLLLACNGDLYSFFVRRHGWFFACRAVLMHWLYYLYSGLTFAVLALPFWLARHGLTLLLLATLAKGLAWSIVIPPWHAPDELQHFFYGQIIERFHRVNAEPDTWLPEEGTRLYTMAQLRDVCFRPLPLDLSDRVGVSEQLALLDSPAVKQTYLHDDGRGFDITRRFMSFHPPFYYAIQAAVQWSLEQRSILVRLLAGRWVSVALGVATVALAHVTGRELWPGRPGRALLLATLVSFQPMVTFCTATVGNEAMEIALFSACLVVLLWAVRGGLTARRALTLGALVSVGLLTKISFLSFLLPLGLLLFWRVAHHRGGLLRELRPWMWVAVLPLLVSGWWYREAVLSGGDALVSSYGTVAAEPAVHLLPYLARYGWVTTYRSVLGMYWGNFGWLDTPLDSSLLTLLALMTAAAVWSAGWRLVRHAASDDRRARAPRVFAMVLLGSATFGIIIFYTYLDFRMARDLQGRFGIQGRYFLPGIIGQMAWLMTGLAEPVPRVLRRGWMWLLGCGMMGLNFYSLFRTVLVRYYGSGPLAALLERATVLQPVGLAELLVICGTFVALTVALAVSLWGFSDESLFRDSGGVSRQLP